MKYYCNLMATVFSSIRLEGEALGMDAAVGRAGEVGKDSVVGIIIY